MEKVEIPGEDKEKPINMNGEGLSQVVLKKESSTPLKGGATITIGTAFGELEVPEDKMILFPKGILGFPDAKRFILLEYDRKSPFIWFQSVEEAGLTFIIIDPLLIKPDYRISIKKTEIEDLGRPDKEEIVLLTIVTIPEGEPSEMTANLRAPLIINSTTMKGKQLILQDDSYPVRYQILRG